VDSMIRILLHHTDQIERAFAIGRQSQSPAGAEMIAKYAIQHSDAAAAVEFLFIAKRHEEAFTMAKQQKFMDIYAKVLGEQGTMTEYRQLAEYYEADSKTYAQAAYYYSLLAEYSRSLKLYLSITPQPSTENIHAAIEVVKKAQQSPAGESLLRQLHDFLIGDSDGVVKDLNYIFRLYLSIGEYSQAAHTATLIAGQEQAAGQYHAAHSILLSIAQELRRRHISIPNELKRQLLLLHSYRLAKLWSQRGNHTIAARMLLRVCKSLSRFPQHTVQILTSTVVECQRAGLKRSAFEYGSVLMRAEYRNAVDVKYRKAIENFIRRPQMDETEETQSRCPFCRMEIPDTDLECVACRNDIPMCAVTLHSAALGHAGAPGDGRQLRDVRGEGQQGGGPQDRRHPGLSLSEG
jgi:WD repeat-containing protein 19